jgi:hypothetical protein
VIPPAAIASALRASATFPGGPTLGPLCQAIAQALVAWLPVGVTIQGVTAGTMGTGMASGNLSFQGLPSAVVAVMRSQLQGPVTPQLGLMLTQGLNASLTGCSYVGVSIGVGTGTDVSGVTVVNVPLLSTTLRSAHAAACAPFGGTGSVLPGFYQALADGIAVIVQSGVTIPGARVTPTGPPGPGPSVGTSLSAIV